MIRKETIDQIVEISRIEDVVGDFVHLRKRGVNLLGLCPFHNEKSPSFTVSPAKGIYKCFGCGKAGNAVNFMMDHDHLSYPEALRYLAKKYGIAIDEEPMNEESIREQNQRESLFIANAYAAKAFSENLKSTTEGQTIGLSYFRERGFTEEMITRFELGYSLEGRDHFSKMAIQNGYSAEVLEKAGLIVNREGKLYDRFWGRVMFPIHNLSGKVHAFGGRILKTDIKTAKYLNSPETDIYHKSNTLYGMYFAKKSVIQNNNCYLVEGYTDVISFHQAGIENTVASSGTSLTVEQIRLIARYTKNVTVLYDGDYAGIKASLRGIDLILEEGLNVKVVLFPDGDDPDSFARKTSNSALLEFLKEQAKDFIVFKTSLLFDEVKNDPVKKAGLIRDIVESIAKIPDSILRATYVKECSHLMDMSEQILLSELNKTRNKNLKGKQEESISIPEEIEDLLEAEVPNSEDTHQTQELEIIRLLLNYASHEIHFSEPDSTEILAYKIANVIVQEISADGVAFENELFQKIFREFEEGIKNNLIHEQNYFINHPDEDISRFVVDVISSPYQLSENWEKAHQIFVPLEESLLKQSVLSAIYSLKLKKVMKMIVETQEEMKKQITEEEQIILLEKNMRLMAVVKNLAKIKGIVILK